jgi:hypothetical protein
VKPIFADKQAQDQHATAKFDRFASQKSRFLRQKQHVAAFS